MIFVMHVLVINLLYLLFLRFFCGQILSTLCLLFVSEEEEFLSPRNVGCFVILFLYLFCELVSVAVFQVSCSVGKFVYFVFSILPNLF